MPASTLVRHIVSEISDLIKSGDLPEDHHLISQDIADRFGVSRSPVREAMQMLVQQGMLEQKQNRGFFVRLPGNGGGPPAAKPAPSLLMSDYQRVAEDWLTDKIPADVTEQMLRERYNFTKAQLNDVLVRATREGWAERKQGYGWRLLPVAKTPQAFDQIYRFRMQIEPAAMMDPEFRLDRTVLTEQRRIQERMLESDIDRLSPERLLHHGSLFHEEVARMSGNPFFHNALVRVNRMRRLLEYRATLDRGRLSVQCGEHLEILSLLEKGEVIDAAYLMRRHLSGALKRKSPVFWDRVDAE